MKSKPGRPRRRVASDREGLGPAPGFPRDAERAERLRAVLDRLPELRVGVLGDLMLDEYRIGEVERISPEAPVPVVRLLEQRDSLGGAGNVASGVLALGASCRLVATLGEDAEGDRVLALLAQAGLDPAEIVRIPARPTSHKLRVIARGQQMLRLDREEDSPLSGEWLDRIRERMSSVLPEIHVLILEDYGKGLLGRELAQWSIREARARGIRVVVDPKWDMLRFQGADLVKPNLEEARSLSPGGVETFEERRSLLEKIQRELGGPEIVMTRGRDGMTALDQEGFAADLATREAEVFDVQGAGDTSIAVLALCRAAGASLVDACIVANAAAAIAVGKRGTATVRLEELKRGVAAALAHFEEMS